MGRHFSNKLGVKESFFPEGKVKVTHGGSRRIKFLVTSREKHGRRCPCVPIVCVAVRGFLAIFEKKTGINLSMITTSTGPSE